jgi:3-oxoacyl-[acyl-carrier-protein] synthase II
MPESLVAVTGLGVVAPGALGAEAFWENLLAGRSSVKTIESFDASGFDCRVAGEIVDFSARKFVPKSYRKAVKVMARDIELAVAASDLAVRDAGLNTQGVDPDNVNVEPKRLGCNIGAGLICSDLDELGMAVSTALESGRFDLQKWGREGIDNLTPLWLLKYLPNMLACHVTIIHDAQGPSNTITCGDASGLLAIGEAGRLIRRGGSNLAFAGGAESKLNPMGLLRQGLLGRLNTAANDAPQLACRPFDADAAGTVLGEGGGLLILEDLQRARQRDARVYAELAGAAAACDPGGVNVQTPTAGGLELSLKRAMKSAGVGPEDIDLIVAHGTGVPAEDALEAQAWRAALGERSDRIPAFSVTGAVGSLFAGSGGLAAAAAAMALDRSVCPPSVGFSRPAESCPLNLADQPREHAARCCLVGSFTVGGQSGACVLKREAS